MAMFAKSKNIVSLVRELKPRKDTSRIEVRIIRLWKNYNKESGNTIEMVFVDREGTRIHASVGEQLINKYGEKLHEGDAIVVQLFKVFDAIGEYHIIGQIVNFGSLENKSIKGKDNMRLLIELRDHSNVKIMCTLWGGYAKQVYDYSMSNMSIMIICIIRFCSIKEWKGVYSISSGFNSTQILLNPTCSLVDEFKLCLPDNSLAITNKDSSQWSVASATSVRARFFVLNERLTIRDIVDSTLVGTFVTLGTIENIDTERGWQYLSCKYHNKKVMPTTNVDDDNRPLFYCNTCDKEHIDVIPRFKLIVHVKDDTGEANFLLFDGNAQVLNLDEDLLPEAVSDLFGKRILFEVSVDADNIKGKSSHYVVRIATADRELIEEFAALPVKQVLMLQSSDDISSGSGGLSGTPLSKRKSQDEQQSSLDDQHSVNKKLFLKKVKGE
ncbi:uncharacterized protein LOC108858173 [Raphanus sativus]|uniref:Uncharacterized protein LOC108858173 n=1 Tax=Raphanus sativus TaxID=3726 RepID=A0A9W3C2M6_RAPSA|nr:uncharacterized protein LOC108858173 [Raphanus sativus]